MNQFGNIRMSSVPVDASEVRPTVSIATNDPVNDVKLPHDCTTEFGQAFVHFTHFVALTYTPTSHDIINAYKRGCAIEAKINAPVIDYILPMMIGSGISFILVQIKNIAKKSSARDITVESAFKGTDLKDHKLPYIAVEIHLGKQEHSMKCKWSHNKRRLHVDIRGLHHDQFPFLQVS